MKVLKFGGSSVANAENINKVLNIVLSPSNGARPVVVVSALGGVTDSLIEIATRASQKDLNYLDLFKQLESRHLETTQALIDVKQQDRVLGEIRRMLNELQDILNGVYLLKELSFSIKDSIMSFGERLSSYIIAEALKQKGVAVKCLDPRDLILTDNEFGHANVMLSETYERINQHLLPLQQIAVVGGFVGSTKEGATTTLGRGGSDYTAALLGAALGSEVVEIWTDVDGVTSADPRKVKNSVFLPHLTYEEAAELAHFGAKVIYPNTMQPVSVKSVPVLIKNTFNSNAPGTLIDGNPSTQNGQALIHGISSIDDICLLRIHGPSMRQEGILARIFNTLSHKQIGIILITQASSEYSICVAVKRAQANMAKQVLEKTFALEIATGQLDPVVIDTDLSVVTVIGGQMKGAPGTSGKLFQSLGQNGINIFAIAQGSSELSISVVVDNKDEGKALNCIHDAFLGQATKTVHVFLIGTGLIGGTLLEQIEKNKDNLKKQGLQLKVVGLMNQNKMLVSPEGIDLADWSDLIEKAERADLDTFINQALNLRMLGSVFVDCTASEAVADSYGKFLSAGIAVVTPNKKGNSGSLDRYKKYKNIAHQKNTPYLYETNVGAGLPVISTLNDLVRTGDEIIKIEAILSGTLSFIFNSFCASSKKFSQIVKEAKDNGFTEPDPRDNLSGLDCARKILILARETGLELELSDVSVEPLLPPEFNSLPTVDSFLEKLKIIDSVFDSKREKANSENSVLRYIATLNEGKASISLQTVDSSHPFYSLSGSDNIISFTTERYNQTPLVIKGPGAGAQVTAAGVFADIIRVFK